MERDLHENVREIQENFRSTKQHQHGSKEVRDASMRVGKRIIAKYKGALMGDGLKINVLRKAIALLQRDVRNEDFTAGSMSTMGSRDRTLSSTMNSMASFLGLGGQRQQRSPDGFKHEAAV